MKLASTAEIKNLESGFLEQLEQNKEAIEKGLLEEAVNIVFEEAKRTAEFVDKTGNLRKSIKKKKSKFPDGGFIVKASGTGRAKGYHAYLVEFGHVMWLDGKETSKRVPAHPFLRPALEKGIAHIEKQLRGAQ